MDSRVSFQAGFRTSVISGITRFGSRNWLIERVLKCECMIIETRVRGLIHTIYYKINVLVDKTHVAVKAQLQRVLSEARMPRGIEALQKKLLNLT